MTVISADAPLEILTGYVPGLPQLAEPDYSPSTFDYLPRAQLAARGQPAFPALEDWIRIFKEAVPNFQDTAAKDPSVPESRRQELTARFAELYIGSLEELESRGATAAASGDVDARPVTSCLDLVRLREKALRDAGFTDIFRPIKRLENEKALELLPEVCEEIDGIADPRQRWEAVVRGVFAGNIFDLGCTTTTEMYHENGMSFHDTREKLVSRPWVIDCLDEMLDRVTTHTYNKAVLFVDNAGADVILGMLPLARELLKRGTTVVVAANELPSINDMTAAELEALLPQICSSDALLCKAVSSQRLRVVSSGSGLPVIDLSQVSHELADACVDADLVILEGMGRSIETNLNARFSVDSLKLGMIKHQEVASALGGRIYDCVCKFDRGGGVA